MRIVTTSLSRVRARARRVAIGQFDGVHVGHRQVLKGMDTVLTFDPHPLAVTRPEQCPRLLMTLSDKAEAAGALGIRELVVVPFDEAFARRTPQEFIDEVIVGALGATEVSVGANFRFGHRAAADVALLAADGRFAVRVAELVERGRQPVSSTRIRALVGSGDVAAAAPLLGRPLRLHVAVTRRAPVRLTAAGLAAVPVRLDMRAVRPADGVYVCRSGRALALLSIRLDEPGEVDVRLVVSEAIARQHRAQARVPLHLLRRLGEHEATEVLERVARAGTDGPGCLYDGVPWQDAYAASALRPGFVRPQDTPTGLYWR